MNSSALHTFGCVGKSGWTIRKSVGKMMITYGKPTDLRLWYYGVAYFPTDPFEHVSHLIVLDAPLRCHSPNQDHQELYPKAPQAQAVTQSSTDLALP